VQFTDVKEKIVVTVVWWVTSWDGAMQQENAFFPKNPDAVNPNQKVTNIPKSAAVS